MFLIAEQCYSIAVSVYYFRKLFNSVCTHSTDNNHNLNWLA